MKKKPLTPDLALECERLKSLFKERQFTLGLTQEKAAAALGMNQGSFSHYLNGRNALNLDFAARVAKLLGVSVSSFSPRLAQEIHSVATTVDHPWTADMRLHGQAPREEHSNVSEISQPWRTARKYPLISWIAAGARAESPDNICSPNAIEYLESTENAGDSGYWLEVRGPSMTGPGAPSFPEGTLILIRPEGFDLVSGKYYVAIHRDGEKTFKQYLYDAGYEFLAPLNPAFKTVELDHDWEIFGRVVDAKIPGL